MLLNELWLLLIVCDIFHCYECFREQGVDYLEAII